MTNTEKELLVGLHSEKLAWEEYLEREPIAEWRLKKWNKWRIPYEVMEFSQLGLFRCNYKQILNRESPLTAAETKRFQRASQSLADRGLIERVKWPDYVRHVSHFKFTDTGQAEVERLLEASLAGS